MKAITHERIRLKSRVPTPPTFRVATRNYTTGTVRTTKLLKSLLNQLLSMRKTTGCGLD